MTWHIRTTTCRCSQAASFNLWSPDYGEPYAYAKTSKVIPVAAGAAASVGPPYIQRVLRDASRVGCQIQKLCPAFIRGSRFATLLARPTRELLSARWSPAKTRLSTWRPICFAGREARRDEAYLLGVLSSIPLDWYARRYVELNLAYGLLSSFPIPRPGAE